MEQKELDEIKTKCSAHLDGATLISNKVLLVLVAEVERLTAENEQNSNYAEIYQDICDKYGKNFRALLDKAKALQAENATLKKALELACKDQTELCPYGLHGKNRRCAEDHKPMLCKSCAPGYYIFQAEQLTRETQEAEK